MSWFDIGGAAVESAEKGIGSAMGMRRLKQDLKNLRAQENVLKATETKTTYEGLKNHWDAENSRVNNALINKTLEVYNKYPWLLESSMIADVASKGIGGLLGGVGSALGVKRLFNIGNKGKKVKRK